MSLLHIDYIHLQVKERKRSVGYEREASGMGVGKHTPTDRTCNRENTLSASSLCVCVCVWGNMLKKKQAHSPACSRWKIVGLFKRLVLLH